MKYTEENIAGCLKLLDQLQVSGIQNCTRVAMIAQILNNPEKEDEDGTDKR